MTTYDTIILATVRQHGRISHDKLTASDCSRETELRRESVWRLYCADLIGISDDGTVYDAR